MKVVQLRWNDGKKINSIPVNEGDLRRTVDGGLHLYNPDSYVVLDYVEPGEGGCWFCYTNAQDDPMLFDTEFDTFVHEDCLRAELKAHPENWEAQIMKYLLGEEN